MKKRIALLSICAIGWLSVYVFFRVSLDDYFAAKELVKAIRDNDYYAVKSIVIQNPESINRLPSIAPAGWNSAMNQRVLYPLTEACISGNTEIIRFLVENGADVNSNDGRTPLSVTYSRKNDNWYEISLYLISNGASLNYTTEYSGRYLSVLCDILQEKPGANTDGYVPENVNEVVVAFDYAIKNCDHTQVNWMRVLQYSVSNDRIEIVEFLLDKGYCEVNDASSGMTALMFAARDSTPEMVELLLRYGADKSKQTEDGKTAYDYAIEFNRPEIISILKD